MYKLKQFIAGIFVAAIISITPALAQTFHGTVTLPTSITDLLDTCSGEECPAIDIIIYNTAIGGYGTAVDYNDTSGVYEYNLEFPDDTIVGDTQVYEVQISIRNGNLGNEYLYYSFGTDNSVGTTGGPDTADVILHDDERWDNYTGMDLLYPLYLPSTQTDTIIDIDLSTKDEGRQIFTGQVKLPVGTVLGSLYDEFGNYIGNNYVGVNISSTDYNLYVWANIEGTPDPISGLYTFAASIKNEENADLNLTLQIYGYFDKNNFDATYQMGQNPDGTLDADDHSIDGDEKLVTGWLDSYMNYATFTSAVIDWGIIDVDAYLVGAQWLTGTLTPPESFPVYYDENGSNSISLSFNSSDNLGFWFNAYTYFDGYNTNASESSNGTYAYEVLIPQDVQEKIQDNNLSVRISFNSSDYLTNEYQYFDAYYSFGDDQQVGEDDHILEGLCINEYDAKPLSLNFSNTLPVVDINISAYTIPVTSKVEVTLTVPETVSYVYMYPVDLSCEYYYGYHTTYSYDNPDGTKTIGISGLNVGHEYGFEVNYETGSWELGTSEWFSYVLNDNDGDFTNGGSFLDEYIWDEFTGQTIFEQTYVATENDVVFSPFELVVPSSKISPAIIMYLLN